MDARRGLLTLAILGGLGVAARRSARTVRSLRALDRCLERLSGMFEGRVGAVWDYIPRVYAGLHRRAVRDAVALAGDQGATVVDVGTGPGILVRLLADALPAHRVIGVEPSPSLRARARRRGLDVVDGLAEALPFPDASIDVVVSTMSVHHWDDAQGGIVAIARVLRPGGTARLYDLRFAGLTDGELADVAAGLLRDGVRVSREILDERLIGLRPYSVITIRRPG